MARAARYRNALVSCNDSLDRGHLSPERHGLVAGERRARDLWKPVLGGGIRGARLPRLQEVLPPRCVLMREEFRLIAHREGEIHGISRELVASECPYTEYGIPGADGEGQVPSQ